MILVEPVEFISIDEIVDNFSFYKDKFIKDSVICFRNANLTEREQFDFNSKIGSLFGWHQASTDAHYNENHSHNPRLAESGPDEVMLSWHIEHPYYNNPILAATWNMYTFNTDTNNGKTYFVDMGIVYDVLSDEERDFLNKVTIYDQIHSIDPRKLNSGDFKTDIYKVVKPHWITGKPILRVSLFGSVDSILIDVDGSKPSEEDQKYLNKTVAKASKIVATNEDIRIVHKWQKGDLVMSDLFKLAHAVTGGFDPKDREFRGIWGWQYDKSNNN